MRYEDIIDLKRPMTQKPKMAIEERAAQFAPFAALTGHESTISQTARITQKRIELEEHEQEILDRKLKNIELKLNEKPQIIITHFVPDNIKEGGEYVKTNAIIRKIDKVHRMIFLQNNEVLKIDDVIDLEIE